MHACTVQFLLSDQYALLGSAIYPKSFNWPFPSCGYMRFSAESPFYKPQKSENDEQNFLVFLPNYDDTSMYLCILPSLGEYDHPE